MLSSITPLGERGRNARWPVTVAFYLIGSILGGAAIGLVLGVIGDLLAAVIAIPLPVRLAVLAVGAALGAALDTDRLRRRLPTIHRQVNEDWLDTYRGWVYGLGFGFQLGLGVVTIVTTAGIYLLGLLILLAGSWQAGLVLGAVFGVARALPVVRMRRVTNPDRMALLFQRLAAAEPRARSTLVITQATLALAAVGAAVAL